MKTNYIITLIVSGLMLLTIHTQAQNGDCDYFYTPNVIEYSGNFVHKQNKIEISWEESVFEIDGVNTYNYVELWRTDSTANNTTQRVFYQDTEAKTFTFIDSDILDGHNYSYKAKYFKKTHIESFWGAASYSQLSDRGGKTLGAVRARIVPDPQNSFSVSIRPTFDNSVTDYIADVNILFSKSDHVLRRPFIIVDGFDPGDVRDYYSANSTNTDDNRGIFHIMDGRGKFGEASTGMVQRLLDNCYDVVFVNWKQGAGDIRDNATLFKEVLKKINATKKSTESNVVVGPSMGGLITRIALTKMEQEGSDHQTRLFISIDSPHLGANIPLGLQHLLPFLKENLSKIQTFESVRTQLKKIERSLEKLNSIAAQQQLLQHYLATDVRNNKANPHPKRIELLEYISHLPNEGWPIKLRKIAMSNGGPAPNREYGPGEPLVNISNIVKVWSIGSGMILDGRFMELGPTISIDNSNIALDHAPGGTLDTPRQIHGPDKDGIVLAHNATFIPTTSAFAFDEGLTQESALKSWNVISDVSQTPFEALLLQDCNEPHVYVGKKTVDWIIEQVNYKQLQKITVPEQNREFVLDHPFSPIPMFADVIDLGNSSNNSSFIVPNNHIHVAMATTSIIWSPGFKVENGANHFSIISPSLKIGGCLNYSYRKSNTETNPINSDEPSLTASLDGKPRLTAYPNPASSTLRVSAAGMQDRGTLQLFDMMGNNIRTSSIEVGEEVTIDVSPLSSGLYIIKVISGTLSDQSTIMRE